MAYSLGNLLFSLSFSSLSRYVDWFLFNTLSCYLFFFLFWLLDRAYPKNRVAICGGMVYLVAEPFHGCYYGVLVLNLADA